MGVKNACNGNEREGGDSVRARERETAVNARLLVDARIPRACCACAFACAHHAETRSAASCRFCAPRGLDELACLTRLPPCAALTADIVDKTADFVARNGTKFEERIRENEKANPKFNFLQPADPYHAYYQFKIKEIQEGKGAVLARMGGRGRRNAQLTPSVALLCLCVACVRTSGAYQRGKEDRARRSRPCRASQARARRAAAL